MKDHSEEHEAYRVESAGISGTSKHRHQCGECTSVHFKAQPVIFGLIYSFYIL